LRISGHDPSTFGSGDGDDRSAIIGFGTYNHGTTTNSGALLYALQLDNADSAMVGGLFQHAPMFVGMFSAFGWVERYGGYNSADYNPTGFMPSAGIDVCGGGANYPAFRLRSQQLYGGLYTGSLPKTGLIENLGTNLVWVDDNSLPQYIVTRNSIASTATNYISTAGFGSTGITNTTGVELRIFGFTGTSVTFSNGVTKRNVSLGTMATGQMLILQPNEMLYGTACGEITNIAF
jgi:hypothetical protein